jgi:hypothetical protein
LLYSARKKSYFSPVFLRFVKNEPVPCKQRLRTNQVLEQPLVFIISIFYSSPLISSLSYLYLTSILPLPLSIFYSSLSYPIPSHLFPISIRVPGRQSTAMRRRCAPEGVAMHGAHSRRMAALCLPIVDSQQERDKIRSPKG